MHRWRLLLTVAVAASAFSALRAEPLPETKPLTREGDLAAQMVEGIDKYLMRELAASVEKRKQYWKPDFSSAEAYTKSVQPNRERLKKILGVVDERVSPVVMEYVGEGTPRRWLPRRRPTRSTRCAGRCCRAWMAKGCCWSRRARSWPRWSPCRTRTGRRRCWSDWLPACRRKSQFARRLAENGCRVLVPVLIDRKDTWSGNPKLGRMTNQPHREFIYRMAYEMGRHIIGYEVQKVLAAVDWFCREKDHPPIGVFGYGEGGLLALYSGASIDRIRAHGGEWLFRPAGGALAGADLPQRLRPADANSAMRKSQLADLRPRRLDRRVDRIACRSRTRAAGGGASAGAARWPRRRGSRPSEAAAACRSRREYERS